MGKHLPQTERHSNVRARASFSGWKKGHLVNLGDQGRRLSFW